MTESSAAYLGAISRLHGYGKLVIDVAEKKYTGCGCVTETEGDDIPY
jgi:hypothetical protein